MNYILFDDAARARLLPFTHTRPVADIRCGILTMRERWEHHLQAGTGTLTEPYLQKMFPLNASGNDVFVNGSVFADAAITAAIKGLAAGEKLTNGDLVIAAYPASNINSITDLDTALDKLTAIQYDGTVMSLRNPWDIFSLNDFAIRNDFALLIAGKKSAPIPKHVIVLGEENLFIEEGAEIGAGCIINARIVPDYTTGPVYIGKKAKVLEGTLMHGPIAVCDEALVKMGAKIYGATTIGPGCKVGGELNNVVFFANSNKAHDGYLGNAVIGEWCNMGADTNCSNLKNNYGEVKVWDEAANKSVNTGLTFCGLIMGDHSKCGINTMFNTGTIVGVSCNIFDAGFPEKFIRSFTWGGIDNISVYDFDRAMETAERMMERRKKKLTATEKEILRHVFDKVHATVS